MVSMAKEPIVLFGKSSLLTVDGESLTNARIAAGLSLGQVAANLECNKSSISRWEQGTLAPSPERIMAMAKMYGTMEFIRLNENATLDENLIKAVRKIFHRDDVVVVGGIDRNKYIKKEDLKKMYEAVGDADYFQMRLNGKLSLTPEDIEAVRKLMEG